MMVGKTVNKRKRASRRVWPARVKKYIDPVLGRAYNKRMEYKDMSDETLLAEHAKAGVKEKLEITRVILSRHWAIIYPDIEFLSKEFPVDEDCLTAHLTTFFEEKNVCASLVLRNGSLAESVVVYSRRFGPYKELDFAVSFETKQALEAKKRWEKIVYYECRESENKYHIKGMQEDAVSHFFVNKVHSRYIFRKYFPVADFLTYYTKAAENSTITFYKKTLEGRIAENSGEPPVDPDNDEDAVPAVEKAEDKSQPDESKMLEHMHLHSEIEKLPEDEKKILEMRAEGMKYKEIAEKTGIPENTVSSKIKRAKEKIREI
jgi:RNA polymerase sigma factor (sigma-70 family)